MSRMKHLMAGFTIAACCLAMAGCSEVESLDLPENTLTGTITYKGKPVPHALVIVTNESAPSAQAQADADGKYSVEHVPAGEVQIGVNTEAGRGMMMSEIMASAQSGERPDIKFVDVPEKFFEPTTSGVTTTINDGANTYDIVLE